MDLLNFFVFELYYTREFMLKVLIQIQKTFKTNWIHLWNFFCFWIVLHERVYVESFDSNSEDF